MMLRSPSLIFTHIHDVFLGLNYYKKDGDTQGFRHAPAHAGTCPVVSGKAAKRRSHRHAQALPFHDRRGWRLTILYRGCLHSVLSFGAFIFFPVFLFLKEFLR